MHYHTVHRYTYSGYALRSSHQTVTSHSNGLDVQSCLLNMYCFPNDPSDTTNPDSYREVFVLFHHTGRLHPADRRYCPGPGWVNSDQGKGLAYRALQFPELHS